MGNGLNLAGHRGVSRMEERERSLENFDGESDAGFRLRIPLMANASRVGERGNSRAKASCFAEGAELTDLP